jgi:hypothetical protein
LPVIPSPRESGSEEDPPPAVHSLLLKAPRTAKFWFVCSTWSFKKYMSNEKNREFKSRGIAVRVAD